MTRERERGVFYFQYRDSDCCLIRLVTKEDNIYKEKSDSKFQQKKS